MGSKWLLAGWPERLELVDAFRDGITNLRFLPVARGKFARRPYLLHKINRRLLIINNL